ncbi:MAG: DUF6531 domain-containing protein [Treponema sp.]|nr:DUF6531 domain-containing protein [Treponema sp.]
MKKILTAILGAGLMILPLPADSFAIIDNGHGGVKIIDTTGTDPRGQPGGNQDGVGGNGGGGEGQQGGTDTASLEQAKDEATAEIENFLEAASSDGESVADGGEALAAAEAIAAEASSSDGGEGGDGGETLSTAALAAEGGENADAAGAETAAASAETAGDPVSIVRGEYFQKETDISLKKDFSVQRIYRTGNPVTGSFGKGWSGTLDQRLLFNGNPSSKKLLIKAENELNELYASLETLNNEIKKYYLAAPTYNSLLGTYSFSTINNLLTVRILSAKEGIEEANKEISKAEHLKNNLRGNDYVQDCKDAKAHYQAKYDALVQLKNTLPGIQELHTNLWNKIKSYRNKISSFTNQDGQNNTLLENYSESRFEGTPEEWYRTGRGNFTFLDESGSPVCFVKEKNNVDETTVWVPKKTEPGDFLRIEPSSEGYVLYKRNGDSLLFSEKGFILKITDVNSNQIIISRDEENKITEVKSSFGETYKLAYEDSFISGIVNCRDPTDKKSFTYENGFLHSVTDEAGDTTVMVYDASGILVNLLKPDGSRITFTPGEEFSDGRKLITQTTDEEGNSEHFVFSPSERTTLYKNTAGDSTLYTYDENFNTTSITAANGDSVIYDYNKLNQIIRENRNGFVIEKKYDSAGNLTEASFPDGTKESFTYDSFGNFTSFTDRDGFRITYDRDKKGNLISVKENDKITLSRTINSQGYLTEETVHGASDVTTYYKYDSFGNLEEEKRGNVCTKYSFDNRNRLICIQINNKPYVTITYKGKSRIEEYINHLRIERTFNNRKDLVRVEETDTITGEKRISEYTYDKRHLPIKKTVSGNKGSFVQWEKEWTADSKLKKSVEYNENQTEAFVTEYKWISGILTSKTIYRKSDPERKSTENYKLTFLQNNIRELEFTDAEGIRTSCTMDSKDKILSYKDGMGQIFNNNYTPAGRAVSSETSLGGITEYLYDEYFNPSGFLEKQNDSLLKKNTYKLSASGEPVHFENGRNEKTEYFYNEEGKLWKITSAHGNIFYHYDAFGRTTEIISGDTESLSSAERYTLFNYNNDGRKITINYGGATETVYELDAWNRPVKVTDGEGNSFSAVYNLQGRISEVTDSYGNKTLNEYDAQNRITKIRYCDGEEESFEYDLNGYCISKKDSEGISWSGTYDSKGNLLSEKGRLCPEKKYTYDNNGNLISVSSGDWKETYQYSNKGKSVSLKDANGNTSTFERNALGRVILEKNRLNNSQSLEYDLEDSVSGKTDFSGNRFIFEYSPGKNTTKINGEIDSIIKSNSSDDCISASNKSSHLQFSYDKRGQLISSFDEESCETLTYTYNRAGLRTRLQGAGRDIRYTYGKMGEVLEVEDVATGLSVSFTYDNRLREIKRLYGNGVSIEKTYDRIGRLTSICQKDSLGNIQMAEAYGYNEQGQIETSMNFEGKVTVYEYDRLNRLIKVYYPEENDSVSEGLENYFLTKDQIERLCDAVKTYQPFLNLYPMGVYSAETYTYDNNGNRLSKTFKGVRTDYIYDAENRLTEICINGNSVVKYQHDKNGNLISEISSDLQIDYEYSASNRMTGYERMEKGNYSSCLYFYDAFNRRILQTRNNEESTKTLYDGLTLDVIKESPVFFNGLFTDTYKNEFYMRDNDSPRGRSASGYDSGTFQFQDSLPLTVSGNVMGRLENSMPEYFTPDIRHSVKNSTGIYGTLEKEYTYDAFGNSLSSEKPYYGYSGKRLNSQTGLYDYGFRDYSPSTARWNTVDPIRDGRNWYSFVANDPVNYVDMWGLFAYLGNKQVSPKKTTVYVVRNNDKLGNSFDSTRYIRKEDCFGNVKYTYQDVVGANCSQYNSENKDGYTLPDGKYYLTGKNLYAQADGTYDSNSYYNTLTIKTNDPNVAKDVANEMNTAQDVLMHANQRKKDKDGPYNSNKEPGSAACVISKDGQASHDKMMTELMDGVLYPESIELQIISLSNQNKKKEAKSE